MIFDLKRKLKNKFDWKKIKSLSYDHDESQ